MSTPKLYAGEPWGVKAAILFNQMVDGKTNNFDTVTLTANAATTTYTNPLIKPATRVFLFPMTANAAAIVAATYITAANITDGQAVITHTNNANADKIFAALLIG